MKLNDHFTQTLQSLLVTQQREQHQVDTKKVSTLYDLLATKYGIDEFYKIIHQFYMHVQFLKEQNLFSVQSEVTEQSFDHVNSPDLDQYLFAAIMNEIFSDFVEYQVSDPQYLKITEVFMLFQVKDKVSYKDLYLIACMFIALKSNQSLEFFYQFGGLIFQTLVSYNKKVLGLTLKVFSKIFGVDSRRVTKIFKSLNMTSQDNYNYDEFEIYCFALCNNDQTQGQGQTHSRFTKQQFVSKNHDMNSPVLQQVQGENFDSSFSQQDQSHPYWSYTTSSQAYLQSRGYKKN